MASDNQTWQDIDTILGESRDRHIARAIDRLKDGTPELEVVGGIVRMCLSWNDRENLAIMYASAIVDRARGEMALETVG